MIQCKFYKTWCVLYPILLLLCLIVALAGNTDPHCTGGLRERTEGSSLGFKASLHIDEDPYLNEKETGSRTGQDFFGPQATPAANLNIHLFQHCAQEQVSQGTSLFLKISQPEI